MHTNSFNDSKSTSSYYNTTSISENGTKITEEVEERENEITFSDKSRNCCVCFVSMLDPVDAIAELRDPDRIRRYYSVFINTTATIARTLMQR